MEPSNLVLVILAVLVAVPTLVIASFPVCAFIALGRSRRATRREGAVGPMTVSVIVPVRGLDEQAETGRRRLLEQTLDSGTCEIVFCVEEENDPATPALRRLAATAPDRVRVLVSGPRGTSLGKVHNLTAGVGAARGDCLVFLDSDTVLPHARFLAQFTRPLTFPRVGLVTCFPAYRGARNIPAALLAASINHDLLGYFAVQALGGRLRVANGSCLALRRDTLEAIGGLAPLRRSLLMDSLLARHIVQAGFTVHLHPEPVTVIRERASVREWFEQTHRWQVAMSRVLSRATYAGFCWMRSAVALALVYVALGGPVSGMLTVLGVRALSAAILQSRYIRDPSAWPYAWLLPFVEMANAFGCLYALIDRRATWRGRRYVVQAGGFAMEQGGS